MPAFRTSRPALASVAAAFAAALMLAPSIARADNSCTSDGDCSHGFTCQTSGELGACPAIFCAPGNDAGCNVSCTTSVIKSCLPAPCTGDSDCASGMVCYGVTSTACTGAASETCAKGDECTVIDPTPPTCTTTTTKTCTPKYDLPCNVDSDCGDHFTCTPDVSVSCWGSGSAGGGSTTGGTTGGGPVDGGWTGILDAAFAPPPEDGGQAPLPLDASPQVLLDAAEPIAIAIDASPSTPTSGCTTTLLSTKSCVAQTIACTSASDCPATWTCDPSPCAMAAPGSPPPACSNHCEPPYYSTSPGGLGASAGSANSGSAGVVVEVPDAAAAGGGRNASGSSSSAVGKAASPTSGGGGVHEDGGCQMGTSPADALSGIWLALAGVAGWAARRRARRA